MTQSIYIKTLGLFALDFYALWLTQAALSKYHNRNLMLIMTIILIQSQF